MDIIELIKFVSKCFNIQAATNSGNLINHEIFETHFAGKRSISMTEYAFFVAENNLIDSTFEETYALFLLAK